MLEQLPHADGANMLDQVQRHEGFARLHRKDIWLHIGGTGFKFAICTLPPAFQGAREFTIEESVKGEEGSE
jgi:hypothetical protein